MSAVGLSFRTVPVRVAQDALAQEAGTRAVTTGVAMQDLLTIEIVPEQDRVTLRLTGEIDMFTATSVRDAALAAMRKHAANIRIDLSGVTFLDSTGLEMLLATRRRATLGGGELQLVDPARTVMRVLEVTGFNWLVDHSPVTAAADIAP